MHGHYDSACIQTSVRNIGRCVRRRVRVRSTPVVRVSGIEKCRVERLAKGSLACTSQMEQVFGRTP
jgi:hypothetical protein